MMKTKITRTIFRLFFLVFCLALIFVGSYNIALQQHDVAEAESIIKNISSTITMQEDMEEDENYIRERDAFSTDLGADYYWGFDDDIDLDIETKEASTLNTKQTGNYYMDVDFESIKEQYPNVVAYLKVNGTNIEYPIVQGEDNSFYLKHGIEGEDTYVGWPFMTYKADPGSMVGNVTIYGHNFKNKTVFGELTKLLDKKSWFSEPANTEIYLVTENRTYVYKIFSVYNTKPTFNYSKFEFKNENSWESFLNILKDKDKTKLEQEFNTSQILTLSTCYNSGSQRLVVHAYMERVKDV